jgi:hypothetical protein
MAAKRHMPTRLGTRKTAKIKELLLVYYKFTTGQLKLLLVYYKLLLVY